MPRRNPTQTTRFGSFIVLLALAACQGCTPEPPTDKPLNAGPALALLGVEAEVYGVDHDASCVDPSIGVQFRDPSTGLCLQGLSIGRRIWLVIAPWSERWSATSLAHEAAHVKHDTGSHDGPWFRPGGEVDQWRATLQANPKADLVIEVVK